MRPFEFAAPDSVRQALHQARDGSAYLAGGTTLVDLMKLDVMTPTLVLDLNALPLRGIRVDRHGLRLGALEPMSEVAANGLVATGYPMITKALLLSASPQLRNMATIGGNLLQRTRCGYFRDTASPCNKRAPGSGCPAIDGDNRTHAVLGTSAQCVATHASDLAVALVALDASVVIHGATGTRRMPVAELYLLPGVTPHQEHRLRPGEIIAEVVVPTLDWARRSTYVKVRDRSSFEFALTSAAVAVDLRHGVIEDVRVAAGGVGTTPWRLPAVERALRGRPMRTDVFEAAAMVASHGAKPLTHNAFKPELLRRTIVRALTSLAV
ncbi:FAD binding domain-containing protein [Actinophytocola xanthii]|uniref:FAD-binding molybdopterin dehydrogenase n=1 Tax=Actinophytocola xanthii TaxID=1912961 RepID=A0A1Q8CK88_9PSEU|nr:xanthine dehydrogenase family protein subunit M [Actinophytocola xanthii]OLF14775.1 FAD-binding molybdopterin dehydrogenase [Actinophytocola xanthii]